jgi:hypothetical protein
VQDTLGSDRTIVLHSGDFLGPSLLGQRDNGKAIVELLNRMRLNYCTLGNHEFDWGEEALAQRMNEADFTVLLSNVDSTNLSLKRHALWPSNDDPLIAITGIVSESVYQGFNPKSNWAFNSPEESILEFLRDNKRIPFRIVLSHASREEDRLIRDAVIKSIVGEDGHYIMVPPYRSYILGGHDHDINWIEGEYSELGDGIERYNDWTIPISKNLANLKTIRCFLLLAGGLGEIHRITIDENIQYFANSEVARWAAQELQRNLDPDSSCNRRTSPLQAYPEDLKELLQDIHPLDAKEIETLFSSPEFHEAWSNSTHNRLGCSLASAFDLIPGKPDIISFTLKHSDHITSSSIDDDFVCHSLKLIQSRDDSMVCIDYLSIFNDEFDASEVSIRSIPTLFGCLVAECVRRKAGADLAIINSGSFRSDSIYPPRLSNADLREIFLYDNDNSIVTLKLPKNAALAMLNHGLCKVGSGAYPQYSPPHVLPDSSYVTLAISAYLVSNDQDGYLTVLSRELNLVESNRLSVEEMERLSMKSDYSIISAVSEYGQGLGVSLKEFYAAYEASAIGSPDTQFTTLVNRLIDLLEEEGSVGLTLLDILLGHEGDKVIAVLRGENACNLLGFTVDENLLSRLRPVADELSELISLLLTQNASTELNTSDDLDNAFLTFFKSPSCHSPVIVKPELQVVQLRLPDNVIAFHTSYVLPCFANKLLTHPQAFRRRVSYKSLYRAFLRTFPSFLNIITMAAYPLSFIRYCKETR